MKRRERGGFRSFPKYNHKKRRQMILQPWVMPIITMHLACTLIQKTFRGYFVRSRLLTAASQNPHPSNEGSVNTKDPSSSSSLTSKKKGKRRRRGKLMQQYLAQLSHYTELQGKSSHTGPVWLDQGFSSFCVVKIQSQVRAYLAKREFLYRKFIFYQIAAFEIQAFFLDFVKQREEQEEEEEEEEVIDLRRESWVSQDDMRFMDGFVQTLGSSQSMDSEEEEEEEEEEEQKVEEEEQSERRSITSPPSYSSDRDSSEDTMARRIQSAWNRYVDRKVFAFFKELVDFHSTSHPKELLKSVIPRECDLFDRAAGIHVRFRLGGASFPPTVLYKVFTHRPLCDVNAFAPRDYVLERKLKADEHRERGKLESTSVGRASRKALRSSMKGKLSLVSDQTYSPILFDKRTGTLHTEQDTSSWYHRVENNDWQPIQQVNSTKLRQIMTRSKSKAKLAVESPYPKARTTSPAFDAKRRSTLYRLSETAMYSRRTLATVKKRRYRMMWMSSMLRTTTKSKPVSEKVCDYDAYYQAWMSKGTSYPSEGKTYK